MSAETGDTIYRSSFITGQNISVRLYAVLDNNQLAPLITEWDKLDVEVLIKSKKNKSIGMGTSRTQTSVEGFRLTLSRAKKDALVDTEILLNQAHMMAYLPNREYVVRLEVNHCYSSASMKAPEDKSFGNILQKSIQQSLTKVATSEAKKAVGFVVSKALSSINSQVNKTADQVLKNTTDPVTQRALRFAREKFLPNKTANKVLKPISTKLQGSINKNIDVLSGIKSFGIDVPDVFQEIYDFQYCSITAGSLNFEPKEISKHNLTLEASFCECSTKTNSMSTYQYNKSVESTLAKFKKEKQMDLLLSNESSDARLSKIQTNVILDSLTNVNSHIILEPAPFPMDDESQLNEMDKKIQEVYSSR